MPPRPLVAGGVPPPPPPRPPLPPLRTLAGAAVPVAVRRNRQRHHRPSRMAVSTQPQPTSTPAGSSMARTFRVKIASSVDARSGVEKRREKILGLTQRCSYSYRSVRVPGPPNEASFFSLFASAGRASPLPPPAKAAGGFCQK